MTTWVLLLRAVNLGARNKLAMADLRALLSHLGHGDVRTFLNSGNATFTSSKRSAKALATEIEQGLAKQLHVSVRAVVLTAKELAAIVDALPTDLDGYVTVCVLFGVPDREGLAELEKWEPEVVRAGKGALYVSYQQVQGSKLTNALMEKRLGVGVTARTPGTLRKLL